MALAELTDSQLWMVDLERHTLGAVTSVGDRTDTRFWMPDSAEVGCFSLPRGVASGSRVVAVDATCMDGIRVLVDERNRRAGPTAREEERAEGRERDRRETLDG